MSAKGKKKAVSAALTRSRAKNAGDQALALGAVLPPRKKSVRKVWGRIKGMEVSGAVYTFEMRKSGVKDNGIDALSLNNGGVFVRKRNSRTVEQVTFEMLTAGGGRSFTVAGDEGQAMFGPDGVMVRKRGFKAWKLVSWEALADCAKEQMTLFPGIE